MVRQRRMVEHGYGSADLKNVDNVERIGYDFCFIKSASAVRWYTPTGESHLGN